MSHEDERELAKRCTASEPEAIALFEKDYMSRVTAYVAHLGHLASPGDVYGAVRDKVLPPPFGHSNAIAGYVGKGPLHLWLRVVSVRVALNLAKRNGKSVDLDGIEIPVGADAASDWMRMRYLPLFRRAVRESLGQLEAKDRNLLRMHFLDGVSMEALASLHGVNRSTVFRWIDAVREKTFDACRVLMRESMTITDSEFESLARDLQSALDDTLSRALSGS
jgi:RNA polymerase sigma-70 factor, ECF subfamily